MHIVEKSAHYLRHNFPSAYFDVILTVHRR